MRYGTTRTLLAGLLAVGAAVAAGIAGANPALLSGTWSGEGSWIGADGREGTYEVEVTISEEAIEARYAYEQEGRRDRTYKVELRPRGAGFFDLADFSGSVIGSMACLEDACVLSFEQQGAAVTESMRLSHGGLERFGTKNVGGYSVTWRETLDAR